MKKAPRRCATPSGPETDFTMIVVHTPPNNEHISDLAAASKRLCEHIESGDMHAAQRLLDAVRDYLHERDAMRTLCGGAT